MVADSTARVWLPMSGGRSALPAEELLGRQAKTLRFVEPLPLGSHLGDAQGHVGIVGPIPGRAAGQGAWTHLESHISRTREGPTRTPHREHRRWPCPPAPRQLDRWVGLTPSSAIGTNLPGQRGLGQDDDVAPRRPPSRQTVAEAAVALGRLLAAVDAGDVAVPTARDRALLRRLQGALAAWQEAAGTGSTGSDRRE